MARKLSALAGKIGRVAAAKNASFEMLVRISGLRPADDFKGADLTGVDLGSANISAYDFSKSILRNANLSKTRGFESAKFTGADLAGAKLPTIREQTERHETVGALASRLAAEYFAMKLVFLITDQAIRQAFLGIVKKGVEKWAKELQRIHFSPLPADASPNARRRVQRGISTDLHTLAALEKNAWNSLAVVLCIPSFHRRSLYASEAINILRMVPRPSATLGRWNGLHVGYVREHLRGRIAHGIHVRSREATNVHDPFGIIDFPFGGISAAIERTIRQSTGRDVTRRSYNKFVQHFFGALHYKIDSLAPGEHPAVFMFQIEASPAKQKR